MDFQRNSKINDDRCFVSIEAKQNVSNLKTQAQQLNQLFACTLRLKLKIVQYFRISDKTKMHYFFNSKYS